MTDDTTNGIETSAKSVLKRAVELDKDRRFSDSIVCYQEGIQLLLNVVKVTKDEAKKQQFRQRVREYIERAEELKAHLTQEKEDSNYHDQIRIENNSTGYGYGKIFQKFLDNKVTAIEVEDPYIRSNHQVYNFLRFCEVVVKANCSNLKSIRLLTGRDQAFDMQKQQEMKLSEIGRSLQKHKIVLEIEYSETLHDREIRFDSGWIVKIGRGLDYFKASDGKFSIGYFDLDLRPCLETTIDIFRRKPT